MLISRAYICRPLWSGAAAKAVVVEADAFKETDVIYRALSSRGHHTDMLQTAELVNLSHVISEIHYKINMYQQSFTTLYYYISVTWEVNTISHFWPKI